MSENIDEKETKGCCGGSEISVEVSDRKKFRTEKEQKALQNRLCRIEGQVRGLEKMLDNNDYCPDILNQVSAVKSALNSFAKALLSSHIKGCVVDDIKAGNEETVDELVDTVQKLIKY